MIGNVLVVAAGGALGAALRYLTYLLTHSMVGRGFPYGTMCVNVLGSLLVGVSAAHLLDRLGTDDRVFLFLVIGVLGGYTTFSTYALDGMRLLTDGRHAAALGYIIGSPLLSLLAVAAGWLLYRMLLGG